MQITTFKKFGLLTDIFGFCGYRFPESLGDPPWGVKDFPHQLSAEEYLQLMSSTESTKKARIYPVFVTLFDRIVSGVIWHWPLL